MTSRFTIVAALLLLAGCGGGGTGNVPMTPVKPSPGTSGTPGTSTPNTSGTPGTTTPAPAPTRNVLNARITEAGRVRAELQSLDQTRIADVPTSGRSVFTGPAIMTVSQGAKSYQMVGDSRVAVDFGSRAVTGNVKNIQGRRENQSTFTASGGIDYSNGTLGTGRSANILAFDYAGNLKVGSDKIGLDGTAIGALYDNPASGKTPPQGLQALDGTPSSQIGQSVRTPNMTATVNGKTAVGQIYVGGRKN
ncbi:hypothetical protein SAMN05444339_1158 [Loktanella atrilutea]|uniref:Uncharacterized protein n=1 Tax=Loktanella atrilutea TaxID=366533 RepID=A0A1M5EV70_LOKAT|nr:hypothetical protein [Loktanella atrilutea]SHF82961.1 hypothetical protein SAMN05444339_1158 [Loktanella atrilutea]